MMRSLFWGVGLDATRGRSVLVHPAGITEIRKGFSNFQVRVLLKSVSLASSRDEPGLQAQLVDFTQIFLGGNLWLISDLFLDTWALIAGSQKNCAFWGTPYHPCLLRLICRARLGGVICTQDHPLCLTLFGCTVIADGALIFANEYVLCRTHYQ